MKNIIIDSSYEGVRKSASVDSLLFEYFKNSHKEVMSDAYAKAELRKSLKLGISLGVTNPTHYIRSFILSSISRPSIVKRISSSDLLTQLDLYTDGDL